MRDGDGSDLTIESRLDDEALEPDDGEVATLEFVAGLDEAGQRLDVAVAAVAKARGLTLSRTRAKSLIETAFVTLDGTAATDGNRKLKAGETIAVLMPPVEEAEPKGEPIPLSIAYEDEHLVVVDKPAGMVVHPAPGHSGGTLVNALIHHCGASLSGIGGVRRPGIVHRLDKDTSGLLVVAKSDSAHAGLSKLFADHGRTLPLTRSYIAFVWGRPERLFGAVDAPLGRHGTERLRMAVVPEERGRSAVTHWRLEEAFGPAEAAVASRIACNLETGRTHQIRVHMAHIGHPVLADPLYARGFRTKASRLAEGAREALAAMGERQALHAAVLGFEHPVTGDYLEFESALPPDLAALQAALAD